jgi:hypothetical protein
MFKASPSRGYDLRIVAYSFLSPAMQAVLLRCYFLAINSIYDIILKFHQSYNLFASVLIGVTWNLRLPSSIFTAY